MSDWIDPIENSKYIASLYSQLDNLRSQHVAEMAAKVEALEWRDKEICTLRKQLGASKDTIRMLLSLLPDSHHIDNCWNWCWDELNGDAQDAVKNGRNEANKVLANINRIGGVNDTKPRQ